MESTVSDVVILISADAEWRAVRGLFPQVTEQRSPLGEWFISRLPGDEKTYPHPVIFFHGGWGKIAAAASTQYAIDRWSPELLVNLGTCGGFEGSIAKGTIVLVERTLVYDILEQMGDYDAHIAHYTTLIDLAWLDAAFPDGNYPFPVQRTLLVSGDRDLVVEEIPHLQSQYGAIAGDWESGAIAWVARRNAQRLLILRGVTDLVGAQGGEAYGNLEMFADATQVLLERMIDGLGQWIEAIKNADQSS